MTELLPPSRWWRYLLAAALGFCLAWWIHKPRVIVETAAPSVELPSGGLVIERAPQAPVPTTVKQAAKEAGGKLERAVTITVQPKPIQTPPVAAVEPSSPVGPAAPAAAPGCSCEPVTVNLGLIRMPDRTRRVVATSDGQILSALDIPVEALDGSRLRLWAAGVSYEPVRRDYGAWVERDLGPFRLGVDVQARHVGGLTAIVRVGIRF